MSSDTRDFALKEDELKMTKQDVMDMLGGLIKRSKRNEQKAKDNGEKPQKFGALYRSCIRGFKGLMEFTPQRVVENVWSDVLRFFNLLITRNTMAREQAALGDASPLKNIFSQLKEDVKEGNW